MQFVIFFRQESPPLGKSKQRVVIYFPIHPAALSAHHKRTKINTNNTMVERRYLKVGLALVVATAALVIGLSVGIARRSGGMVSRSIRSGLRSGTWPPAY